MEIQQKFDNVTSKIETYQSNILEVWKGVPQGSILGPYYSSMYCTCVNDFIKL